MDDESISAVTKKTGSNQQCLSTLNTKDEGIAAIN